MFTRSVLSDLILRKRRPTRHGLSEREKSGGQPGPAHRARLVLPLRIAQDSGGRTLFHYRLGSVPMFPALPLYLPLALAPARSRPERRLGRLGYRQYSGRFGGLV